MGGGGGGQSRLKMDAPELELQMIDQLQSDLANINRDMGRIETMRNFYDQQMATIQSSIEGVIPAPEAISQLQTQTGQLGQALGMSAQELIESGFLTENMQGELEGLEAERQALAGRIGAESQDPRLIEKQREQRAQLEQELRRAGVGGAQLDRELARFDSMARQERYGQAEREFAQGSQVLQAGFQKFGLGQEATAAGFQRALGGFGASQAALEQLGGQFAQGQQALLGIAGGRFAAGQTALATQQALREEKLGQFQTMGQFDLSSNTGELLEAGVIGPGTFGQQTGIGRENTREFRDVIKNEEKQGLIRGSFNRSALQDIQRRIEEQRGERFRKTAAGTQIF
jgi:hypothetical protein